jgi:hypothetical protein
MTREGTLPERKIRHDDPCVLAVFSRRPRSDRSVAPTMAAFYDQKSRYKE